MGIKIPKLMISGTSGDSGKTMISLGIAAAFTKMGKSVAPFKKGPDYIDAAWLGAAAKQTCRNIDTFLMTEDVVKHTFVTHSQNHDIALIEANRGIFDGSNADGTHSSAEVAKLLKCPILLIVNATKSTRTLAAIVLGCLKLDPEAPIKGVILNKVAGPRHIRVATESIEKYCKIPVVGAIPKLKGSNRIPGRHLGLIPVDEYEGLDEAFDYAAEIVEKHLNLDKITEIAENAEEIETDILTEKTSKEDDDIRIGVLSDGAFSFYYPENIEKLKSKGAKIIFISSLNDKTLPKVHALYIGGGFPETHAEKLVSNESLRKSIRYAAEDGLPIYAECGGLMYLSKSIEWKSKNYEMCGILPVKIKMFDKPQGHGYSLLCTDFDNPFFKKGLSLSGHEFHYSQIDWENAENLKTTFAVERGTGLGQKRDGILYKNTLALYTHIHASGVPEWVDGIIKAAKEFKSSKLTMNKRNKDWKINE